jgi:predicted nucleic acid-binding protein
VIVFDSSTLILLAKKELLDMFLDNFDGIVAIPKAVRGETCIKESFDALLIEKRVEEEKIKVYEVEKKELIKKLTEDFNLKDGEAEAIILCIERGSKILATDDKNAINACKVLRIGFTTAINILIRLYEKQLIEREKALMKLDNLRVVGRYKEEIIEDANGRVIRLERWT